MNQQYNHNKQNAGQGGITLFKSAFLRLFAVLTVMAISVAACSEGHHGGFATKSSDGRTYLSVMDDNGGKCRPIMIDGKVWPHKIGEAGPINPGRHEIECGGHIDFDVPSGVIFHFQYR